MTISIHNVSCVSVSEKSKFSQSSQVLGIVIFPAFTAVLECSLDPGPCGAELHSGALRKLLNRSSNNHTVGRKKELAVEEREF